MPVLDFRPMGPPGQHEYANALALVQEHAEPFELSFVKKIIRLLDMPEDELISERAKGRSQLQRDREKEWVEHVLEESCYCLVLNASEGTWNDRVHHDVLKRGAPTSGNVQIYTFTSITFPEIWKPKYGGKEQMSPRIVDFGYYLDTPDQGTDADADKKPVTRQRIDSLLKKNIEDGHQSVNFFLEEALDTRPVGIFVKTKGSEGTADTANKQLEYWISSWHIRTYRLLTEQNKKEKWILVPVIRVCEDSWTMQIARYVPGRKAVLAAKRFRIGGTNTPGQVYLLTAVLEILVEWMGEDFYRWFGGVLWESEAEGGGGRTEGM